MTLVATTAGESTIGTDGVAIRPFRIDVPQADLDDLKRRIATRWPEPETVNDETQGVQFATMKALADHWAPTIGAA